MTLDRRTFAQFCAGLLLFPGGFSNKKRIKDPPYTVFEVPHINFPFQIFRLTSKDRLFFVYVKEKDDTQCWVYFDGLTAKPIYIRLIKARGKLEDKISNIINTEDVNDILVFKNKNGDYGVLVILNKKEK